MKNILQTSADAGSFKTLVSAIRSAGLWESLSAQGPFTVFASNDVAFESMPPRQVQDLLRDKKRLRSVLKYHIVDGRISSSDVVNLHSARTVHGQEISIDSSRGVMIGDARVIQKDIRCTNGVIHVIDKVLMPK